MAHMRDSYVGQGKSIKYLRDKTTCNYFEARFFQNIQKTYLTSKSCGKGARKEGLGLKPPP